MSDNWRMGGDTWGVSLAPEAFVKMINQRKMDRADEIAREIMHDWVVRSAGGDIALERLIAAALRSYGDEVSAKRVAKAATQWQANLRKFVAERKPEAQDTPA